MVIFISRHPFKWELEGEAAGDIDSLPIACNVVDQEVALALLETRGLGHILGLYLPAISLPAEASPQVPIFSSCPERWFSNPTEG
jgi:hypothetical protein